MAYIYCITNTINNKRYVGKTLKNIKKRFEEHCKDSRKQRCNKRPLYNAMNKYGIDNFIIEELEYVKDESLLSEKEIYWINKLQTYGRNGYNATKGGDGKILYDYNEIVDLYNLGFSAKQISNKFYCDTHTINNVLRSKGIKSRGSSNKINQYDLNGNYIQSFDSTTLAMEWLIANNFTNSKSAYKHIIEVCFGIRPSMYKFKWKFYINDPK